MARHTVNRSIMYPNDFFENISSLTSDDHLCGVHTFKLGNTGPPCNPTNANPAMDLNIGSFDCQTNNVSITNHQYLDFEVFPNPSNDFFMVSIKDLNLYKFNFGIRVLDLMGKVVYENKDINQRIETEFLSSGLYLVQLTHNNRVVGVKKLVNND